MITATYETRTYSIPAGLSLRENGKSVACDDCRAWAWLGDALPHSKSCDTRDLQAVDVATEEANAAQTAQAAADVAEHGRKIRRNQYAGQCEDCGAAIAAGAGELFWALAFDDGGEYGRRRSGWAVRCLGGCLLAAVRDHERAVAGLNRSARFVPSATEAEQVLGAENATRIRTAVAVAARQSERKGGEREVRVVLDETPAFRAAQVALIEDALVRAAVSWRRDEGRYLVTADPTSRRFALVEQS